MNEISIHKLWDLGTNQLTSVSLSFLTCEIQVMVSIATAGFLLTEKVECPEKKMA